MATVSRSKSRTTRSNPGARIVPLPLPHAAGGESIRWSRVSTAQARIASGYYDRQDVQDRLADALVDELTRD